MFRKKWEQGKEICGRSSELRGWLVVEVGRDAKIIEKNIGDLEVWEEKCHSQTLVDFGLKITEM